MYSLFNSRAMRIPYQAVTRCGVELAPQAAKACVLWQYVQLTPNEFDQCIIVEYVCSVCLMELRLADAPVMASASLPLTRIGLLSRK